MRASLRSLLFCVASLLLPVAAADAADFKVYTEENVIEGKPVGQRYAANRFYSTYYIYVNVIRMLEVEKHLSGDEVGQVIDQLIDGLEKNGMAQLVVAGYPGDEDLRITLRTAYGRKHNKPILILISNFDVKKKAVVADGNMNDLYATYFFLVGDKLVKYQLFVNAEKERQEVQDSINDLADFYLLDADSGNDAKGKQMLIDGLSKPGSDRDHFFMNLTLSEYYLLEHNAGAARKVLDKAREIANSTGDAKRKQTLLNIYQYADDVYRYMTGGQSI